MDSKIPTDAGEPLSTAERVALACEVLGRFGLARESTGHVSARSGPDRMLLRCRGAAEAGLVFTTPDVVREVDLTGRLADDESQYKIPSEWPIHAELYRARPDIGAVAHAHPEGLVACMAAGLELKPIFFAFDPPAASLALEPIPIYPRSSLVRTPDRGRELARILANRPLCLLRGHGVVAVGATVEEATLRVLRIEALAVMTLKIVHAGGTPASIPEDEIQELAELARRDDGSRSTWVWRHYVRLAREGARWDDGGSRS